jgi:hypothetical protein
MCRNSRKSALGNISKYYIYIGILYIYIGINNIPFIFSCIYTPPLIGAPALRIAAKLFLFIQFYSIIYAPPLTGEPVL